MVDEPLDDEYETINVVKRRNIMTNEHVLYQ